MPLLAANPSRVQGGFVTKDGLTMRDLRTACPLVTVECTDNGLAGRDASGSIVVQATGTLTRSLIKQFLNAYYRAVAAGVVRAA